MALGAVLLAALIAAVAFALVGRPAVAAVVDEVAIECEASSSVSQVECESWGTDVLSGGPPSATFEMGDVSRVHLQRPNLGLSPTCRADYFISRYADEPVWSQDVSCYGDARE